MQPVDIHVSRGCCTECGADILLSNARTPAERRWETMHEQMLVVVSTPTVDGKVSVALGPCQYPPRPLHGPSETPVVYFGHARHYCGGHRG